MLLLQTAITGRSIILEAAAIDFSRGKLEVRGYLNVLHVVKGVF